MDRTCEVRLELDCHTVKANLSSGSAAANPRSNRSDKGDLEGALQNFNELIRLQADDPSMPSTTGAVPDGKRRRKRRAKGLL